MRLTRAIAFTLLIIHVSWAKFDPCRFNFGTKLGAGSWDEVDIVSQYTYSGSGLESDIAGMLNDCRNSNKTPALYMYVIAKSSGLGDCNTGGGLCSEGANYIRNNKDRIKNIYNNYASAIKNTFGTEEPILLLMEPDYYQYAQPGTQNGNPLSFQEAGTFLGECIDVVKGHLPNAWISLDVSPWIEDQGTTVDWLKALPLNKADFMNTSGGVSEAANSLIKGDNRLTWKRVHDVTDKCIIADAGYGVGGGGTGHDNAWDDVTNINNRINDGVVAIIQFSPKGDWSNTLRNIKGNLSEPICPCDGIGSPRYSLTIEESDDGSVTKSPDENSYKEGTIVTLTAEPDEGYKFAGWSGDATGNTAQTTITMDKDKKVKAEFIKDNGRPTYTLTVNTSGSGFVEISPEKSYYDSGTVVTLSVRLVDGATFNGWSGALSGNQYRMSLVMNEDKTVTATFSGDDLEPAENLIKNGDFSNGNVNWDLGSYEGANANGTVENGVYKINISSPGTETWNIQFTQGGISLDKGKNYVLSFYAKTQSTTKIITNIGMPVEPYTSYSEEKEIELTDEEKKYSISFSMNGESTSDARLEFNSGTSASSWQIDDVVLSLEMAIGIDNSSFTPKKEVSGVIHGDQVVSIFIYDYSGRLLTKAFGKYNVLVQQYCRQVNGCRIAVIQSGKQMITKRIISLK